MAKWGLKVQLVKKSELPKFKSKAESAALRILNQVLQEVALPAAQKLAPGSIPSKIFVIPATGGTGKRITGGLGVPSEYLAVEFGAKPHLMEPSKADVLLLEDGNFVTWVEHPGQPEQFFLKAGVEAGKEVAPKEIIIGMGRAGGKFSASTGLRGVV